MARYVIEVWPRDLNDEPRLTVHQLRIMLGFPRVNVVKQWRIERKQLMIADISRDFSRKRIITKKHVIEILKVIP